MLSIFIFAPFNCHILLLGARCRSHSFIYVLSAAEDGVHLHRLIKFYNLIFA